MVFQFIVCFHFVHKSRGNASAHQKSRYVLITLVCMSVPSERERERAHELRCQAHRSDKEIDEWSQYLWKASLFRNWWIRRADADTNEASGLVFVPLKRKTLLYRQNFCDFMIEPWHCSKTHTWSAQACVTISPSTAEQLDILNYCDCPCCGYCHGVCLNLHLFSMAQFKCSYSLCIRRSCERVFRTCDCVFAWK